MKHTVQDEKPSYKRKTTFTLQNQHFNALACQISICEDFAWPASLIEIFNSMFLKALKQDKSYTVLGLGRSNG